MPEELQKQNTGFRSSTGLWIAAVVVIIALMLYSFLFQREPEPGVPATEQIILTGILYFESEPMAVIGSKVVRQGDTIHGIKVIKIYKDKVEFEKDDRRWTLHPEQSFLPHQ